MKKMRGKEGKKPKGVDTKSITRQARRMSKRLIALMDLSIEKLAIVEQSACGQFNWGQIDGYCRAIGLTLHIRPTEVLDVEVPMTIQLRQLREEEKARKERIRIREYEHERARMQYVD